MAGPTGGPKVKPRIFIIEMPHKGGAHYILCEEFAEIDPYAGNPKLPDGVVARWIKEHLLAAAPIPETLSEAFAKFAKPQTGRSVALDDYTGAPPAGDASDGSGPTTG